MPRKYENNFYEMSFQMYNLVCAFKKEKFVNLL